MPACPASRCEPSTEWVETVEVGLEHARRPRRRAPRSRRSSASRRRSGPQLYGDGRAAERCVEAIDALRTAQRPAREGAGDEARAPSGVAVAGLGYWGPNLARNFAAIPGCELTWCCDASEEARERCRAARSRRAPHRRARGPAGRRRARRGRARDPGAHPRRARGRGAGGRQALLRREAARAVGAPDAERAVAAAARGVGRVLMVGHLLEYHPGVAQLKEMIDAGELGALFYVYWQPPQPRQAARGRERALEPRRPRRLGRCST